MADRLTCPSPTASGEHPPAPTATPPRPRLEERLCQQLIALIEQGVNPWRKPWNASACGKHRNLITSRPYRGSNPALLELQLHLLGTDLPLWIGFQQAAKQGWHPRKGSHGCLIYKPLLLGAAAQHNPDQNNDDKSSETNSEKTHATNSRPDDRSSDAPVLLFRPGLVFNAADLQDAPERKRPSHHRPIAAAIEAALAVAVPRPLPERLAAAEQHLAAWPVSLLTSGNRAYYVPRTDQIHLPPRSAFHSPEAFLATWAHEQIHSTGHPSRLNRKGVSLAPTSDGTDGHVYAREELIAELGAFLLTQRLEINSDVASHAAYLSDWATLLGQGPRQLTSVLSEATRAANLLCPEPINS